MDHFESHSPISGSRLLQRSRYARPAGHRSSRHQGGTDHLLSGMLRSPLPRNKQIRAASRSRVPRARLVRHRRSSREGNHHRRSRNGTFFDSALVAAVLVIDQDGSIRPGFQDEVRKAMDDVSGPGTPDAVTSGKIAGPDEPLPARATVPVEDLPPPPDDPSRN